MLNNVQDDAVATLHLVSIALFYQNFKHNIQLLR